MEEESGALLGELHLIAVVWLEGPKDSTGPHEGYLGRERTAIHLEILSSDYLVKLGRSHSARRDLLLATGLVKPWAKATARIFAKVA